MANCKDQVLPISQNWDEYFQQKLWGSSPGWLADTQRKAQTALSTFPNFPGMPTLPSAPVPFFGHVSNPAELRRALRDVRNTINTWSAGHMRIIDAVHDAALTGFPPATSPPRRALDALRESAAHALKEMLDAPLPGASDSARKVCGSGARWARSFRLWSRNYEAWENLIVWLRSGSPPPSPALARTFQISPPPWPPWGGFVDSQPDD